MWIAETLGVKGDATREFAAMARLTALALEEHLRSGAEAGGVQSGKRGRVGYVWLRGQEPPA